MRKTSLSIVFFFALLITPEIMYAQVFEKPKSFSDGDHVSTLYVEFGGNALLGSFNYDLIFPSQLGIRIGVSPTLFFSQFDTDEIQDETNSSDYLAVVSAFKLYGKSIHKLETGLGFVFGESSEAFQEKYAEIPGVSFNLGYRFLPKKKNGLSFRLMFTPILNKEGFMPGFGASLGVSIKNN